MMTTPFRGHPEQYLHTPVRTHHTLPQKQTLLRRGLGFSGVGGPSHVPLASLLLMFIMRFSFRGVKTFLAAPALCTY